MKILCCGFFPALQRTIEYASFRPCEVNRARKVSVAASGKVTNTARVLNILGANPLMLSFAGGGNGDTVRELLESEQLSCRWVETKPAAATAIPSASCSNPNSFPAAGLKPRPKPVSARHCFPAITTDARS